jgi:hypothetical protein
MSENSPQKRVYMRPTKPANEMNEEEMDTFAKRMYLQIMETLFQQEDNAGEQISDPRL